MECLSNEKAMNRKAILSWLSIKLSQERRKKGRVLCLPGKHGIEIKEIWRPLGFKNKNIYAITNERDHYYSLKQIRNLNVWFLDLYKKDELQKNIFQAINNIKTIDFKYYRQMPIIRFPFFDVIYFDLYHHIKKDIFWIFELARFTLKHGGIVAFTLLAAREKRGWFEFIENIGNDYQSKALNDNRIAAFIHLMHRGMAFFLDNFDANSDTDFAKFVSMHHQNGKLAPFFWPIDFFVTRYRATSPMITVLGKFKHNSRILADKRWELIFTTPFPPCPFEYYKIPSREADKRKIAIEKKKFEIIEALKVFPTNEVADAWGISPAQARAIKAHITMGTYG